MSDTRLTMPVPRRFLKSRRKPVQTEQNSLQKQTSFTREELEACTTGDLFLTSDARLPAGQLLMMDRILDIKPHGGLFSKGEITSEFDVNPDCWFFDCHFIGEPLMPGSLMLEGMWQTLGFYLG